MESDMGGVPGGRFAVYIPPIMQALTLAEVDDTLLQMRAI